MGTTRRLARDFVPRGQFLCPRKVLNWYPGFQEKTINQLKRHQSQMDIIIEVRDARVPFSSVNPDIEATFGKQQKRLIVFTKCDLVPKNTLEHVIEGYKQYQRLDCLVLHQKSVAAVKSLIDYMKRKWGYFYVLGFAESDPHLYPTLTGIVLGIPNSGKSLLINRMRNVILLKNTHEKAGTTQSISSKINVWMKPKIYLFDSPGFIHPRSVTPIQGLRLATIGASNDETLNLRQLADYILYRLNGEKIKRYLNYYELKEPTNDIDVLLEQIAQQKKVYIPETQTLDLNSIARMWINDFRNGSLGKICLDDTSKEGVKHFFENGGEFNLTWQDSLTPSYKMLNEADRLLSLQSGNEQRDICKFQTMDK